MAPVVRTLLLTDLVDSTKIVEGLGDARAVDVLAAHDALARELLASHSGREIDRSDGFLFLFEDPAGAAAYALAYHDALADLSRELGVSLRARAGLHVGSVTLRQNRAEDIARGAKPLEVDGVAKAVAARLMAMAGGGQTLVTEAARAALGELARPVEIVSHGHYQLKGVQDPVAVAEIGIRGRAPFVPPADSPKAWRVVRSGDLWRPVRDVPCSLPAERDAFVGRSHELGAITRALDGGVRLLTIVGTGGTGKTRLALRHAWTSLGSWPGGAWFCDLSESRTLDGVTFAVARALGVPLGKDEQVVQLGHALAGRRRCLVVLDNFEQVAEHSAATVGRWLERAPEAVFVVTSRERLLVPGEHVLALDPLSPEGAGVELFVARAKAQRPDFALTEANDGVVRAIVRTLDGLPLAIELAAARVRVLSAEELLGRLKDRFRVLVGVRATAARQSTLRSAIDWSWDLLQPFERAALAQASVFVGGFTLASAEAVLDLSAWPEAPPTVDVVESLVDRSLLRTWVSAPEGRAPASEQRFGMYASIQEYAAEKLRTTGALDRDGSGAAARRAAWSRHAAHFAASGSPEALAALHVHGGAARRRALALELENLLVAGRRAAEQQEGEAAAACLAAAWAVLEYGGMPAPALELSRLVAALPRLGPRERARVTRAWGKASLAAGLVDEASRHLETALALHRELGDRRSEGEDLGDLGVVLLNQSRFDEARHRFEEALALDREVGHRRHESLVLGNLGILHWEQGRIEESVRHHEWALAIHREIGDRRQEGTLLANLGVLHANHGRADEARRHFEAALEIHRESGDRRLEGRALGNLAALEHHHGLADDARRRLEEALAIHREVGNRRSEGIVLGDLGVACREQGKAEEARRYLDEALAIHREVGNRTFVGAVLAELGSACLEEGRADEARRLVEEALAIHRDVGDVRSQGIVTRRLGVLAVREGRLGDARGAFDRAESLLREVGDRFELGKLACARAACERAAGDLDAARRALSSAELLADDVGASPSSVLRRDIRAVREDLECGSAAAGDRRSDAAER